MAENIYRADFPFAFFARENGAASNTFFLFDCALKAGSLAGAYDAATADGADCAPLFYTPEFSHLMEFSPVILPVAPGGKVHGWIFANVLEELGVFIQSPHGVSFLAKHFARFLEIHDEAGNRMLLRFYDPFALHDIIDCFPGRFVMRLLSPCGRLLLNAYNRLNIHAWNIYTKKPAGDPPPESHDPLIPEEYLDKLHDRDMRKMINAHAIQHAGLMGFALGRTTAAVADFETGLFTVRSYQAKESFVVTDKRYSETCARLRASEKKYAIDNFAYLRECDLLMLDEDMERRARYDRILLNTDMPVGQRIKRCQELEG